MEVNPGNRKYFTVQLTAEFLKTIRIPTGFASDWKGKSRRFCRLKAADYQKSVRVCMMRKQGHYYLTHGWRNLVQRLQLVEGSFVSFFLIPPRTFEVLPFPDLTHHETFAAHTLEDSAPADGSAKRRSSLRGPLTRKILESSYMRYMILPMPFARETGIIDQESVVLTDEDGKDWAMNVKLRKRGAKVCRVDLTEGWSSFRTANNFFVGQTLEFEFHESTAKVHVKKIQE